jgi:integrase/recombinase XerD
MSVPARVIVVGPLAEHAEGYWAQLTGLGYTPWSATGQLRLMAHLSRWMAGERLEPARLTDEQVDRFVAARRAGHTHLLSVRGLAPLLGFLRACGVIPAPVAVNTSEFHEPVRRILDDFGVYLSRERVCSRTPSATTGRWPHRSCPDGSTGSRQSLRPRPKIGCWC